MSAFGGKADEIAAKADIGPGMSAVGDKADSIGTLSAPNITHPKPCLTISDSQFYVGVMHVLRGGVAWPLQHPLFNINLAQISCSLSKPFPESLRLTKGFWAIPLPDSPIWPHSES